MFAFRVTAVFIEQIIFVGMTQVPASQPAPDADQVLMVAVGTRISPRPPGRRRRSPAPGSHRTWRADFPHHALRQLVPRTHSPSPSAPPRHATPSNSETRKCYAQQVSPCLNGRHGSPQRFSNFGRGSVSYEEAPQMLIVLLGPHIAIFRRHDTPLFLRLQP